MIEEGHVSKGKLQPARSPFFISAWWHMQDPETWPIFYASGRNSLQAAGGYQPVGDPLDDYFRFRECFLSLARALELPSWELEHLLSWYNEKPTGDESGVTIELTPPTEDLTITRVPFEHNETGTPIEETNHTHIQYILATIGQKLGCKIWIAANDHNRLWQGRRLGNLSIPVLPPLGIGTDAQDTIKLIDVIWLKHSNQVVAAFEVEHTTSIYSGLLRLADLVTLTPSLNYPLYIVTPKNRLEKVRRELKRPAFQTLALHEVCGFFSFEDLLDNVPAILQWASSPAAIAKLADKVTSD
jgi:hypothetical protein